MTSVTFAGIHVLGFKPIDRLKPHHNLREPTFIYPTDRSLQGSTTAFIALHDAMLQVSCSARLPHPQARPQVLVQVDI